MRKKPQKTTDPQSPVGGNRSSNSSSNSSEHSHATSSMGFIPFFFFLSLSISPSFSPAPAKIIIPKPQVKSKEPQQFIAAKKNQPETTPPISQVPQVTTTITEPPKVESIKTTTAGTIPKDEPIDIIAISRKCPASVSQAYSTVNESVIEEMKRNTEWCQQKIRAHKVQIGRSWGTLSRADQQAWDTKKCNEIVNLGRVQPCEERYGWKWLKNWLLTKQTVVAEGSKVQCIQDYKTTSYCKMEQVVLDFQKMTTHTSSRSFAKGFLTFYGKGFPEAQKYLPLYPGMLFHPQGASPHIPSNQTKECDYTETRPTFILSNDDIYNLGHYMNDVIGIWSMVVLANRKSSKSLLINFDGYRYGGPAGVGAHRLMVSDRPDEHGPYSGEYFHKWFNQQVVKARDYQKQRVCFQELYIFPLPGIPWFWNGWSRDDECSFQAASPLYQSFNIFLRQTILDDDYAKHQRSLIFPSEQDYYHIIIEVRSVKANNPKGHSSSRHIKNLAELQSKLSNIELIHPQTHEKVKIKVTAQNFGKLSFAKQIQLAHTASVLVSMHGAGTTHIFHMAVGDRKCCGLMELFPDRSIDLYAAKGYGNLARMLGLYHDRYVAEDGRTRSDGTTVNAERVTEQVSQLLQRMMRGEGTCLHNVKDTREAIFPSAVAL